MLRKIEVVISEATGLPIAEIADRDVWELVEFLSIQRIRVTYTYNLQNFIVSFHHSDVDSAQAVIDEWARSQQGIPAMA